MTPVQYPPSPGMYHHCIRSLGANYRELKSTYKLIFLMEYRTQYTTTEHYYCTAYAFHKPVCSKKTTPPACSTKGPHGMQVPTPIYASNVDEKGLYRSRI